MRPVACSEWSVHLTSQVEVPHAIRPGSWVRRARCGTFSEVTQVARNSKRFLRSNYSCDNPGRVVAGGCRGGTAMSPPPRKNFASASAMISTPRQLANDPSDRAGGAHPVGGGARSSCRGHVT